MRKFLLSIFMLVSSITSWSQSTYLTTSQQQLDLEKKFDGYPHPKNIDQFIKEMSAHPHHVGSPGNKKVSDFIYNKFKSWGYDVNVETFYVLFPTPKTRLLEMTEPSKYKAIINEPALKEDATSGQADEQLPPYNCWSADGDVTAELVFVNYGVPEDYNELQRMGIDVKGKIVIAKYGQSWRGIKPKVAQEHGAIGCIIYSDPHEDGYFQGDVYPTGAFKNEYGVQRGSVMDMPVYPGDPLTPGIASTKDAKRLDRKDAGNLLKIPVLPISYHDAQPLLRALEGPVAPPSWRGSLPFTYHVGPGKTKVHLKLEFNWDIKPLNNIIAKLPGSEFPDEWVIRGNHHDAWVNGASDPLSGQAALLEEARSMSELLKTGWKPKRTIVFCAWDGEEPALLGSTEWVEYHADELQQKAVIYINTDDNGKGFLDVGGSHALQPLINEIGKTVIDPETNINIVDRRRSKDIIDAGNNIKLKQDLLNKKTIDIDALGSGSDFSPFLQHIGIPSINLGFGGENAGGEYHSIYDSYDDYRRFKDPNFVYGTTLVKTAGRVTLRMADADILPFEFKAFSKTVDRYLEELVSSLNQMRENTSVENRLIREGFYGYADDPTKKLLPPSLKDEVPYLNFADLQNALTDLDNTTNQLSDILKKSNITAGKLVDINKLLYRAEQKLLSDAGLPKRPWYKHCIYAPGFYTGYGVKTFPGIREAIEQRNWKEAQEQIEIDATIIKKFNDHLATIINHI
ncbi:MAG: M28 family peptidase [Bacteroidetes bacterium]|nr:M28 family peptidase [Bacteroidota bacterium]